MSTIEHNGIIIAVTSVSPGLDKTRLAELLQIYVPQRAEELYQYGRLPRDLNICRVDLKEYEADIHQLRKMFDITILDVPYSKRHIVDQADVTILVSGLQKIHLTQLEAWFEDISSRMIADDLHGTISIVLNDHEPDPSITRVDVDKITLGKASILGYVALDTPFDHVESHALIINMARKIVHLYKNAQNIIA